MSEWRLTGFMVGRTRDGRCSSKFVKPKHLPRPGPSNTWAADGPQTATAASRSLNPTRLSTPGPAGLAAAQQLARPGHEVHVFELEPKPGRLLRYGIPDFKMEKHHIDRRVRQMEAEGVVFHCGVNVG